MNRRYENPINILGAILATWFATIIFSKAFGLGYILYPLALAVTIAGVVAIYRLFTRGLKLN